MNSWDKYFIDMCIAASKKSKDPSTKVGAIIVGPDHEIRSTGWNGFARGVNDDPSRYNDREVKYEYVSHAEVNAIYNAARIGTPLKDCIMYVCPLYVCNNCAIAIIQVGIKEIVMINMDEHPSQSIWTKKWEISRTMFEEANIKVRLIEYDYNGNKTNS